MELHQFGGQNGQLAFQKLADVLANLGMCNRGNFAKCHSRNVYRNTLVAKVKKTSKTFVM